MAATLNLIIQFIAGIIGANIVRVVAGKNTDLGNVAVNSVVGAVGGVVGGQIATAIIAHVATEITSTEFVSQVAASLAAGALLIINVGLFDKRLMK